MSELYRRNNVVGFNTYGEQYRSMHVNQTLTGVAIGKRPQKVMTSSKAQTSIETLQRQTAN